MFSNFGIDDFLDQKFPKKIRPKTDASEKWRIFGNLVELKMRHFLVRQCTLGILRPICEKIS